MEQEKRRHAAQNHPTRHPRRSRRRRRRRLWLVLAGLFFLVFCYSGVRLGLDLYSNYRDKKGFEALSALVVKSGESAPSPTEPPAAPVSEAEPLPGPGEARPPKPTTPLPQYARLHELNDEFFGWLTVEGLEIDYPVMYSPTRTDYYLNRDFYGTPTISGTPYIDGRCPADGNYYLIYGHLMQNKTVFGRLPEYAEEACWRENPVIGFDTVFEERQYAVMSCFYSRLYEDYEQGFRYYQYFDLTDEATFNEYVSQVMAAALYDTGVRAEYGDELLVLTSCSHHTGDGRFVVVAKRVE